MQVKNDSYNKVLDQLMAQALIERDPNKSLQLLRRIERLQSKRSSLKEGLAPQRVWWPVSCRGIVG